MNAELPAYLLAQIVESRAAARPQTRPVCLAVERREPMNSIRWADLISMLGDPAVEVGLLASLVLRHGGHSEPMTGDLAHCGGLSVGGTREGG